MARTKRSRRSYGAGESGRDWTQAKKQADEFAAGFASPDLNGNAEAEPEPLTLGTLFDIYGEEVTPTKGKRTRERDRVATAMFLRCSRLQIPTSGNHPGTREAWPRRVCWLPP